jgi:hypothetical protein
MLVETERGVSVFEPIHMDITFESQQEVDQFHNIFNCSNILNATAADSTDRRVITGTRIRNALEPYITRSAGDGNVWTEFFSRLKKSFSQVKK